LGPAPRSARYFFFLDQAANGKLWGSFCPLCLGFTTVVLVRPGKYPLQLFLTRIEIFCLRWIEDSQQSQELRNVLFLVVTYVRKDFLSVFVVCSINVSLIQIDCVELGLYIQAYSAGQLLIGHLPRYHREKRVGFWHFPSSEYSLNTFRVVSLNTPSGFNGYAP
jgi:hypothetical protein